MALLTLDDVKPVLGFSEIDDYDAQLQGFIDAAVPVIEDIVGPVASGSVTQVFDGATGAVVLNATNIASIDSLTVDGVATVEYTADLASGILYAGSQYSRTQFGYGTTTRQNVEVTYTVGSETIPPNVKLAAIELVRTWWQVGRQGTRPGFGEPDATDEYTPSGYAVPRRVFQLCAPNMRPPSVA